MVGDWEGTGWQLSPAGKTEIKCREFVAIRAGGGILTISDHQARKRPGAENFESEREAFFTVIYTDKFLLNAYGASGKLFEAEAKVGQKKMEWEIPGAGMRMSLYVDAEGVWIEEGFRKTENGEEKVFELILRKVK